MVEEVCNALYVIDEKHHINRFEGQFSDYKRYALKNYHLIAPEEDDALETNS